MTPTDNRYAALAAQIATENGIPAPLFVGLVQAESAFNPNAVSARGAIGLSQLLPGTASALGVNPYDPIQNLRGGARYLKQQLQRFGSVEKALAAYNAGPGAVQQYGGVPPYRETQNYVHRVEQLALQFAQRGLSTPGSLTPPESQTGGGAAEPPGLFNLPFQPAHPFFAPSARSLAEGDQESEQVLVAPPSAFGPRAPGWRGWLGIPQAPSFPGQRQPGDTPIYTGGDLVDPEGSAFQQQYGSQSSLFDEINPETERTLPAVYVDPAVRRLFDSRLVQARTDPEAPENAPESPALPESEYHLATDAEVEKIPGWQQYLRNLFRR